MYPIISLTIFLPLLGAILVLALRRAPDKLVHAIGIITSGLTLLAAIIMWSNGVSEVGFSQLEHYDWIPSIGVSYIVGVDGISLPLVLLSTLLFFVTFIYSAKVRQQSHAFIALMLLLETASIGVFTSLDAILFYVFFEVSLVSMYFMIAQWGHEDRQRAALMFFVYTFLGSLPLLLAILGLYLGSDPHTFDMRQWIAQPPLEGLAAMLALIGMLITFAVKTPVFPFHTWLPAAHVQAPAAGSVILAGVMLKFGTYGLIRFALQMTPDAFRDAGFIILIFGVIAALYGAFAALAQTDLKRLVAYTSINHMGYIIVAIAIAALASDPAIRAIALDGSVLQMVSHGLVTGALFLLVGMLQDRAHTREMDQFGGLLGVVPVLGWSFILVAFASLGLPGLAHFPAEFQIFLATLQVEPNAIFVIIAVVVTAGLYLRAISKVFLGQVGTKWNSDTMSDLSYREILALGPLLILTIALGISPAWVLDIIHSTTSVLQF